jgi:hypothetical protein
MIASRAFEWPHLLCSVYMRAAAESFGHGECLLQRKIHLDRAQKQVDLSFGAGSSVPDWLFNLNLFKREVNYEVRKSLRI